MTKKAASLLIRREAGTRRYAKSGIAVDLFFARKGARLGTTAVIGLERGMSRDQVADYLEATAKMLREDAGRAGESA